MFPMDIIVSSLATFVLTKLPNDIKNAVSNEIITRVKQIASDMEFRRKFEASLRVALQRFITEYEKVDVELVEAIAVDKEFLNNKELQTALLAILNKPDARLTHNHEIVAQSFITIFPSLENRTRVNQAVTFLLKCLAEEVWLMPEFRPIYALQFQRLTAEADQQQVALLKAQLQATISGTAEVTEAVSQLSETIAQHKSLLDGKNSFLLPAPLPAKPYHNLPRPDYTSFVGRLRELEWLRQRLAPTDRTWQILIKGIGGVGKSSLALAIAYDYLTHYEVLPIEERFDAIIWVSSKTEVLTPSGPEAAAPVGLISRTLEDIYFAIALTLGREEITRALRKDQDQLVQKALIAQRTLLIIDNQESITDERVKPFLRNLPLPTKCILTSREWIDVADVLPLTGLDIEDAEKLIVEEAQSRQVTLNISQQKRLIERTAALPLPIKLSIARMAGGETYEQVLRWLGNVSGDLPAYCVKGQFDLANQRQPNSGDLLLACALFDQRAGAPREALGYITDISMVDRDETLTILQRLSLVNVKPTDRFWLLPIVKEYASFSVQTATRLTMLKERWITYFDGWVQKELGTQPTGIADARWWSCLDNWENFPAFDADTKNLLDAIDMAYELRRWQSVRALVINTIHMFWYRAYGQERIRVARLALHAVDELLATPNLETVETQKLKLDYAWLHLDGMGWVYVALRKFDLAREELMIGKNIAVSLINLPDISPEIKNAVLDAIALADRFEAQIDIEENKFQEAEVILLDLVNRNCSQRLQNRIQFTYGLLKLKTGDYQASLQYFTSAYQKSLKIGSKGEGPEMIRDLVWLSEAYLALQDYKLTREKLQEAMELIQTICDQATDAFAKRIQGRLEFACGNYMAAEQWLLLSLDSFERLGMSVEMEETQEDLKKLKYMMP